MAPETRGLIDSRRLALSKPGALLINVARAAIVDEDALYAALKEGHLGGVTPGLSRIDRDSGPPGRHRIGEPSGRSTDRRECV